MKCVSVSVGSFEVQKVTPQANGESAKIKVKVRVNIHGLFSVACANMLEKIEPGAEDTADEPMEVENGPSGEEKPKDEEKEEEQNKEEDKEKENSEVTNEGDEPKEGKVEEVRVAMQYSGFCPLRTLTHRFSFKKALQADCFKAA